MGDLNVVMLSHSNSDTKFIRDLTDELSLKLVSTGPTHHTSSRSTCIDLLLVDQCEAVKDSNRVLPPILSRHDIISVTIRRYWLRNELRRLDVPSCTIKLIMSWKTTKTF